MGDNLPAVDLGSGRHAVAVSLGAERTCALLDDGSLKCWGAFTYGALGQGDYMDRGVEENQMGDDLPTVDLGSDRRILGVTGGMYHSCALLEGNRVKCWGQNHFGTLGLGDTEDRGDDPGEMGDALPFVDLGGVWTNVQLSANSRHTCAVFGPDFLRCWGSNEHGELGLGDGENRGDDPWEMGNYLPFVYLGTPQSPRRGTLLPEVSAGFMHTCARTFDGPVKCWGWNGSGELGVGDTVERGREHEHMGDALPAVDLGGLRVASVRAGRHSTCVLFENRLLKCWGRNGAGSLGLGDREHRGDEPGEMGDALPFVDLGF